MSSDRASEIAEESLKDMEARLIVAEGVLREHSTHLGTINGSIDRAARGIHEMQIAQAVMSEKLVAFKDDIKDKLLDVKADLAENILQEKADLGKRDRDAEAKAAEERRAAERRGSSEKWKIGIIVGVLTFAIDVVLRLMRF